MSLIQLRMLCAAAALLTAIAAFMMVNDEQVKVDAASRPALFELSRSLLRTEGNLQISTTGLVDHDQADFRLPDLPGVWTVVYFGFTECSQICPLTLSVLSEFARDPASGVPSGVTRLVFVSINPLADSASRLKEYLSRFNLPITGLTGDQDLISRFADSLGAGAATAEPDAIRTDHATSLFVINDKGRSVGVLLRPSDPRRIVADLQMLRESVSGSAMDSLAR